MKILCFGTFAHTLKLCKESNISDHKLVGTLTRTVDPNCQYGNDENASAVSRLLSCKRNLSPSATGDSKWRLGQALSNVIEMAQKADKPHVVQKFKDDVIHLLDEDKKEQAVLALLDLIDGDLSLASERSKSFEKYLGVEKNELLSQKIYYLDELLAGIFLYTTAAGIDNKLGKNTIKEITINLSNTRGIEVFDSREVQISKLTPLIHSPIDSKAIKTYLDKAKVKYGVIKTLLYNHEPKPFYDFYVCNDIERRLPNTCRFRSSSSTITIENISIKSLIGISRFIILVGTGGLGKSMMMRHLLLNAIDSYDDVGLIPIFIPLKDFDESVDNLFEHIFSKVATLCANIAESQLMDALDAGKCLLLFDALDEISSTYGRPFERFSRFSILQLKPFTKPQALQLIEHLEFRPDKPMIKKKFQMAIDNSLYRTHKAFIENPLLLTIMLLTFEQYAEVPSKMHIFYQEAFAALAVKHDASKGAYRRVLKTGLTNDRFADYFAEFCWRSYHDEKFELTEAEFFKLFSDLKEPHKNPLENATGQAFLFDLCSNMCLMFREGGKYYFTHQTFQEYFCALFFSKQKDKFLPSIGDFFENRRHRIYEDKTFEMLYDMIPDKVEEYIFIPFLTNLYERCDREDGFWTFLEIMYPHIRYQRGETDGVIINTPTSYLFNFIKKLKGFYFTYCDDLPHLESLVSDGYVWATGEDGNDVLISINELNMNFTDDYGYPDIVGWEYEFEIEQIRKEPVKYKELLTSLNEKSILKQEYEELRAYLSELLEKQRPEDTSLLDLL